MFKVSIQAIADALSCQNGLCGCHHRSGNGKINTHCPAHDDQHPSLSLEESREGKVLFYCQAGCSQEAVIAALQQKGLWPHRDNNPPYLSVKGETVKQAPDADRASKLADCFTPGETPVKQAETMALGLTLDALSTAKCLPVDFLRSLELSDRPYNKIPAVRMPYRNSENIVKAVRFRLNMNGGDHFRWRSGDTPMPYGLDRLESVKRSGWVLLVEGESDCWTAWYHDIPALGIPGKTQWKPQWAQYLEGLDVYLWQEPDAGDLSRRIAKDLPDLKIYIAPAGIKDISEAHVQGRDIAGLLKGLDAVAYKDTQANQKKERCTQLYQQAVDIVKSDDPLVLVEEAMRSIGYGGDITPAKITYLAATSRLLAMRPGAMPVHLLLSGPSSAGKSYTLMAVVLPLLPEEAYHVIDAGSPRVVIYDDADLKHKVLVFGEADSLPAGEDNPVASALRNLLQDHHLHYHVTERNPEAGTFWVRRVNKAGPTTLITTATRPLGNQLNTRFFTLDIPHDVKQIQAALITQASMELQGPQQPDPTLVAFQAYLQTKAPWDVIVPFADKLAEGIGRSAEAPRINRDFSRIISLIKSVSVLRHAHRDTDEKGRIIAQIEDYITVRELIGPMYESSLTGASEGVRGVVEAVSHLAAKGGVEKITASLVALHLNMPKPTAGRYIKKALGDGWLVNNEARKYHPFALALGESLPDRKGLPHPDSLLFHPCFTPCETDISYENGACFTVSPVTGGKGRILSVTDVLEV